MAKTRLEHNHHVLSQREQEKKLGIGREYTKNLGHDWTEERIAEHPAPRVPDYSSDKVGQREIKEGQRHTQGVYGRHVPTPSGISSADNLAKWGSYAQSNSYGHSKHVHGEGRPPSMPDPRGSHSNESDGHLASTKNWAGYEYGSESGLGRIEKAEKARK